MSRGVTYDSGALIAAEKNDGRMWALHKRLLNRRVVPTVPAVVVAQAWRGDPRQTNVARFLAPCTVEPLTEELARGVGVLAGRSGHADIVDCAVVDGALRRGDTVVTSDAGDLRHVADAVGAQLRVEEI